MPELNSATTAPPAPRAGRGLQPVAGSTTRCATANGELRPHWEYLIRSLEALGADEFERRCARGAPPAARERRHLQRLRRRRRPRSACGRSIRFRCCSPAREWSVIEQGLDPARRAARSAARRSLRPAQADPASGLLPPELIYAHPGFLRPCVGVAAPRPPSPAALRRRPGAHARRADPRHRRPHAGALGRRLRAGEPHRAVAHPAQPLPRLARAPPGAVLPRPARARCTTSIRAGRTIRASCCSRRARTTRRTSSTPSWRAISATRWCRAAT